MTRYLIILWLGLFCGMVLGYLLGINRMVRRASDGVCMRTDEGEVYLRMSEAGQIKLSDPKTRILYLTVMDVTTRNNHPL